MGFMSMCSVLSKGEGSHRRDLSAFICCCVSDLQAMTVWVCGSNDAAKLVTSAFPQ